MERWKEHYSDLLNQSSEVNEDMLSNIEQCEVMKDLAAPPTLPKFEEEIASLQNGKSPGDDGPTVEIYKHGGAALRNKLLALFCQIWQEEDSPHKLKDTQIVTIYKKKGSKADCANYRGISLLSVAGKILTKILQKRINTAIVEPNVAESQCDFRRGRGTADMIIAFRQIQEKCIQQHRNLLAFFIDLTKAFDTVNRHALWQVLTKNGIPTKIVNLLKSLHNGMLGTVKINGETTDSFPISTGVKQGCTIAPTLFIIYFDTMLNKVPRNCNEGIYVRVCTDGSLFN